MYVFHAQQTTHHNRRTGSPLEMHRKRASTNPHTQKIQNSQRKGSIFNYAHRCRDSIRLMLPELVPFVDFESILLDILLVLSPQQTTAQE
jgi:hypothetical protein